MSEKQKTADLLRYMEFFGGIVLHLIVWVCAAVLMRWTSLPLIAVTMGYGVFGAWESWRVGREVDDEERRETQTAEFFAFIDDIEARNKKTKRRPVVSDTAIVKVVCDDVKRENANLIVTQGDKNLIIRRNKAHPYPDHRKTILMTRRLAERLGLRWQVWIDS